MKFIRGLGKRFIFAAALSSTIFAGAHESSHEMTEPHSSSPSSQVSSQEKAILDEINQSYLKEIKPIFQRKCFDCHSSQIREPWYRNLPGARQLIDRDIKEAQTHLNMDSDFPFESHASPLEDLESLQKSVSENEMPPFRYWALHPGSRLSSAEKTKITEWIRWSQAKLAPH